VDIATLPKADASAAHHRLLHDLRRNPRAIIAYTDGSQLLTATGTGYSIPTGLPHPVRAIVPMGDTVEVFDAELRAIYECLLTCRKHMRRGDLRRRHIHIFTDNQAAITRASCLTRGPGQETAWNINDVALNLHTSDTAITIHWVPGHTNIPGNDDADTLAKQAASTPPTTRLPISLSWLRRRVREQYTTDWITWYDTAPKPQTYSAPHRRRFDTAYTTLPCKLATAILGLRTGQGYFLNCLARPPSDTYPSRSCTCPMHPPQTPKHLLLACPEHREHRTALRRDLKLHCHSRLNLDTILYTSAGTKALSTFLSATKVATAEWAHTKLSRHPAERDIPVSLTTGCGTLLEHGDEHGVHEE
jgi:ribonuclease HI